MRRVLLTAVYLALIILVLTLMSLAGQPVEAPEPTPTEAQTPAPTPTPEPTLGTVSIPMPDGFDGNLDRLWVGIEVEGKMEGE